MPPRLLHKLCMVIWLVAFGFGQLVAPSFWVRCTDSAGQTRVKLASSITPHEHCSGSGGESDDREGVDDESYDSQKSCDDRPLDADAAVSRMSEKVPLVEQAWAIDVESLLPEVWLVPRYQSSIRRADGHQRLRPPDRLAHLRSVILLV